MSAIALFSQAIKLFALSLESIIRSLTFSLKLLTLNEIIILSVYRRLSASLLQTVSRELLKATLIGFPYYMSANKFVMKLMKIQLGQLR